MNEQQEQMEELTQYVVNSLYKAMNTQSINWEECKTLRTYILDTYLEDEDGVRLDVEIGLKKIFLRNLDSAELIILEKQPAITFFYIYIRSFHEFRN